MPRLLPPQLLSLSLCSDPVQEPSIYDPETAIALGHALYEDRSGADVVLHAQGQRIPAHRLVLMAQSPVFQAMFCHDSAEKSTGNIEIEGYSAAAVRELKRFMYTGKAGNLRDVGAEVLELAVMYDLPLLKALCAKALPDLISESSACGIFATAQTHSLHELRDCAVKFMNDHPQVFSTAQWKDSIAKDVELVTAFCKAQAELSGQSARPS